MSTQAIGRPRGGDASAFPAVRRSLVNALVYAIALILAAIVIVPLVYVVLGGFRTTGDIAAQPVALPQIWRFSNYVEIITSSSFWWQVFNSTAIAVGATVVVVAFGALAAFPLARMSFRGRDAIYTFFTLGLLFPIGAAALPIYIMLRQLNLLDTGIGVALPEAAFGLPVTIVILRPFMRAIPAELEDAAVIDGASRFTFFWRILIPLSRPALTTVAIVSFVGSWNAFLLPLLVIGSHEHWTIPLGVSNYSTQYTSDTARILAFTALSMLPALAFFLAAERRIVGGLSGAVKG
jgi:raffinose/stachyose/melibiose transport system permease protein